MLADISTQHRLPILVRPRRSSHNHVKTVRHNLLDSCGARKGYSPKDWGINTAPNLAVFGNAIRMVPPPVRIPVPTQNFLIVKVRFYRVVVIFLHGAKVVVGTAIGEIVAIIFLARKQRYVLGINDSFFGNNNGRMAALLDNVIPPRPIRDPEQYDPLIHQRFLPLRRVRFPVEVIVILRRCIVVLYPVIRISIVAFLIRAIVSTGLVVVVLGRHYCSSCLGIDIPSRTSTRKHARYFHLVILPFLRFQQLLFGR
mmetsp:Transcript_2363/g.5196  ORF Transcript_2363/g.5196 Transcript_2363/m.5196 type:complete len:255 (+) Transcript_2363:1219-1983(+)